MEALAWIHRRALWWGGAVIMRRALELGEWRLRACHEPQLGGHLFDAIVAYPSALVVAFDDHHAVANAGLALTATLAERLGVEAVVDELVSLGERPGHHRPGRKVLTLLHAMVAGGDAIDDAEVLRTARTQEVLGHRVMAPSTLGTFLRSFTFGHIPQLDQVAETVGPDPV
jgi:hypothetical protein